MTGLERDRRSPAPAKATTRMPSAPPSARRHPTASSRSPRPSASAPASSRFTSRCKYEPWFLRQIEELVRHGGDDPRARPAQGCRQSPPPQVHGLFRPAPGRTGADRARTRCAPIATSSACARSSSASTPVPPNSLRPPPICTRPMSTGRRGRVRLRSPEDHHPRRRPQPHRPGHRVRLLLLPCLLRAA